MVQFDPDRDPLFSSDQISVFGLDHGPVDISHQ